MAAQKRKSRTVAIVLLLAWLTQASGLADPCSPSDPYPIQLVPMTQVMRTMHPIEIASMGGGSGNGGGTGIACFATPAEAAEAKREVLAGNLAPATRAEIQGIQTTDRWEFKPNMAPPLPGETAEAYVMRILNAELRPLVPLFYESLSRELAAILPSWRAMIAFVPPSAPHTVPPQPDLGFQTGTPIPASCTPVQLAHRDANVSSPNDLSNVTVDWDRDLINRLGSNPQDKILDEAVLLLHEAIYLMGSQLGQQDSSLARQLTAYLLSQDFYRNNQDPMPPPRSTFMAVTNTINVGGFWNYPRLFVGTGPSPRPDTPESRRAEYADLNAIGNREALEAQRLWVAQGGSQNPFQDPGGAGFLSFEGIELAARDITNNEEAFLYWAKGHSLALPFNDPRRRHVEDLLVPGAQAEREIGLFCQELRSETPAPIVTAEVLVSRAVAFCSETHDTGHL